MLTRKRKMVIVDLTDCKLLEALRDAWMLVRFMETDEGQRISKETNMGMEARQHFSKLLEEAAKRELNFTECLQ
jgi:hypothetical protein